jgi:hypothetical protein
MERVLAWFRMLGTSGAVVNARLLADQRERERWIVDALEARLAEPSLRDSPASAA